MLSQSVQFFRLGPVPMATRQQQPFGSVTLAWLTYNLSTPSSLLTNPTFFSTTQGSPTTELDQYVCH